MGYPLSLANLPVKALLISAAPRAPKEAVEFDIGGPGDFEPANFVKLPLLE
jgi:hypothetical protein